MSIEKIIQSIPKASQQKRAVMRRNALEKLESEDPEMQQDAQRLLEALDGQEASEQSELIGELQGLDRAERVVRAFSVKPMTETEEKLIRVLLDNPGKTSTELSELIGWGAQSWHLHFGTMCADRAIYLWPAPPAEWRDGKFYSGILADFEEEGSRFAMKPDVAAAFAQLGLSAAA